MHIIKCVASAKRNGPIEEGKNSIEIVQQQQKKTTTNNSNNIQLLKSLKRFTGDLCIKWPNVLHMTAASCMHICQLVFANM